MWILHGTVFEPRDRFEFRLLAAFLPTKKPVLAVCRGMQLVNAALGGTLLQDLPVQCGLVHHAQTRPTAEPSHEVCLREDSLLAELLGTTLVEVNSHHHQAVDVPASVLRVIGWAADGIVEAVEHRDHPFLVGVQWHPERLATRMEIQRRLFEGFVEACRGKKDG